MRQHRYLSNVTTLELDRQKCNGCGVCLLVCPHAVLILQDKKAAIVERDACMECGACATNCPEQALYVRSGVGCAYAIILSRLRRTKSAGGCGDDQPCCG